MEDSDYVRWLVEKSRGCIEETSLDRLVGALGGCGGRCTVEVSLASGARLLMPCSQLPEAWANILHVFCLNDYRLGELVEARGVVVDAGAYLGFFTVRVGLEKPRLIVAVEPNPVVREYLYTNVVVNGMEGFVRVDPRALDSEGGRLRYLLVPDYWGNASLEGSYVESMGYKSYRRIPVRTVTLKGLLEDHRLERVDLLKVDIEGSEVRVLESSVESGILEPGRVGQVIVEVHEPLRENTERVSKLLASAGYHVEVYGLGEGWKQAIVFGLARR